LVIGNGGSAQDTNRKLVLLEWNIQGLLEDFLQQRTNAVISEIQNLNPDVVLLQEVIPATLMLLKASLENQYEIKDSRGGDFAMYFTAILTKKTSIHVNKSRIITFSNSMQGRNVLFVEGNFKHGRVVFITSHLESMKTYAVPRIDQFKQVVNLMCSFEPHVSVIFAGDTNLSTADYNVARSSEKVKNEVFDAWEFLGSQENCRYTWDLQKNDNQIKGGKARCRYERVYFRKADPAFTQRLLKPSSLKFIGTTRLACGMFPSDHWGMLTEFAYPCDQ